MLLPTRIRRRPLRHAFEDALEEARDEPGFEAEDFGLDDGLRSGAYIESGVLELAPSQPYVGSFKLSEAYADEADPDADRAAFDPLEAARQVDAAIAKGLSPRELSRLRRRFAAQNHPDRVPPQMREAAAQAMADINAKIDKALAAARVDGRRGEGGA